MATGNQVLSQALVLNQKTQSDALVSAGGTEIVDAINRSLRGIYQIGARVNPSYHGAIEAVTEAGGAWLRPSNVELLYRIEQESDAAKVYVSDPEEPVPDPEKLWVVKWGRTYRQPPGLATPSGNLTFFHSKRPTALAALTGTVDLEDFFVSLLVYDLGIWLAEHDERNDEVGAALRPHLEHYLRLYIASLEHEAANVVRNVGQTGTFDSPSLVDLKSLLLSGAAG